jgi:exodeoxyribonuclease V alpha subunit
MTELLQGKLAKQIFAGKGGFAIISIATTKGNVVVTGTIPQIEIGAIYSINGEWIDSPKYGRQFKAISVEVAMPADRLGVVAVLKSLDGIGEVKARRIVDAIGADALHRIVENPACIIGIAGIGEALANRVASEIAAKSNKADSDSTLLQIMGPKTLEKAKEEFGAKWLANAVRENPYRLICIPRVTILKVDTWVLATNRFAVDSPERCAAIVAEGIKKSSAWGHCWLEADLTVREAKKVKLAITVQDDALIAKGIECAIAEEMICEVECNGVKGYALHTLAAAENKVATILSKWQSNNAAFGNVEFAPTGLTESQLAGVKNAVENRVSILTGGPGTGKTFTTKSIIAAMYGADVQVLAPTGKAAKRASQLTGTSAMTIHRFIGNVKAGNIAVPQVIVVDEASMVNVTLMSQLVSIIDDNRSDARMVIVGDVDQLPSIEAGNVLGDCIESGVLPCVRLGKVMRQAAESLIVKNAAFINAGNGAQCQQGEDFTVCVNNDPNFLKTRIVDALKDAVAAGANQYTDVQVLVGQKGSDVGAEALNVAIREAFNPAGNGNAELLGPKGVCLFRVGDKVMVVENDYDLGVVNGDQGVVKAITTVTNDRDKIESATVTVTIDETDVDFVDDNISMLIQSWAITVHKSQGSEYPLVLFVSHSTEMDWAIQRALTYTAITRGKEKVKVFCNAGAIDAASKAPTKDRLTRLVGLLKEKAV